VVCNRSNTVDLYVQQSYELMRHAKRRKLTTVDFNNALQNADVQVLLTLFFSILCSAIKCIRLSDLCQVLAFNNLCHF